MNDIFLLEVIILISISFYITSTNLLLLLYTGGLYLLLIGGLAFLNDSDIYIGFLWVIDLGVGLVFFIFILHFTLFLFQKSELNLTIRHFLLFLVFISSLVTFYYYWALPIDNTFYGDLSKTWFFKITYLDYYMVFFSNEVTDLNTLRDSYFLLNSFEFFIINFSLFFGILAAILMCFMIHRVFNFLNYSQIININILNSIDMGFFIRNQNFMTQQQMSGGVRVWSKEKK
jgi:hypothetical protein